MKPHLLCGAETEYGLYVEGQGVDSQIDDAMALVRKTPDERFSVWDYRFESPRADLRGFTVKSLAFDPDDAKLDIGKHRGSDAEVRSDQILTNGARFYNDHGHPEYATPECASIFDLVHEDQVGQQVVLRAAQAYAAETGREVSVYKNNTDFHGASYGTHENYLVPRSIGWERLYRALAPLFIARQVLCGAGKVGSESGPSATYQISQRADFFVEPFNTETLYRRPIFNLRDEPHADANAWLRLHVICGDANMIPFATFLKFGLTRLAIRLVMIDEAPLWRVKDPVRAFQSVSRDESEKFEIELDGGSWTTADNVIESFLAAGEACLELTEEELAVIQGARETLASLRGDRRLFNRRVDWAARRALLEEIMAESGSDWRDPFLRSYDLEYSNVDPEKSLFSALVEMDRVETTYLLQDQPELTTPKDTRAALRGHAVCHFKDQLLAASWRALTFDVGGERVTVELPVEWSGDANLDAVRDVESFIHLIRGQA